MFEDATFDSRGIVPSSTPKWMLATLGLNLTILAALFLLPLMHPQSIPADFLPHLLLTPPSPATPAPKTQLSSPHPLTQSVQIPRDPLLAPRVIPSRLPIDAPPVFSDPGPASSPDGVVGGTGPIPPVFTPTTKPVAVRPIADGPRLVSSTIISGLLLHRVQPLYPPIAVATRTTGTVTLGAIISKSGAIEDLHVVSGPPMLRQAALEAVGQWRYRPYLLNNQPIEVETTINVVFSLGSH